MRKSMTLMFVLLTAIAVKAQTMDIDMDDPADVLTCANAGNDVCQNLLGKWLFEGSHGFDQDFGNAVKWWLHAAEHNNEEAMGNLGFCYLHGLGVNADSSIAAQLFEKSIKMGNKALLQVHDSLARGGSVISAMLLGRCYKLGRGVPRNPNIASEYYMMAVERGNVEAMVEAAMLMLNVKKDSVAFSLFQRAMQNGDLTATYYCGKMMSDGRGTNKDALKGAVYLQKAAEQDYATAQFELAEAYRNGNGVSEDKAQAVHWYRKAALGGNRAAWWKLSECYRDGIGVSQSYESALECYLRAYSVGYHNKLKSLLNDGGSEWTGTPFMTYLRGCRLLEVDGNPDAARKEFARLPKNCAEGQTMQAVCLLHSSNAQKDVKKAVKILRKQADKDSRAAFELALLQIAGDGVERDLEQAEKTLLGLAERGYPKAVNYLADCYYEGRGLKQDRKKATMLYLKAEKHQHLTSIGAARLSVCYKNGEGVKQDAERAQELEKYKPLDIKTLLNIVPKI